MDLANRDTQDLLDHIQAAFQNADVVPDFLEDLQHVSDRYERDSLLRQRLTDEKARKSVEAMSDHRDTALPALPVHSLSSSCAWELCGREEQGCDAWMGQDGSQKHVLCERLQAHYSEQLQRLATLKHCYVTRFAEHCQTADDVDGLREKLQSTLADLSTAHDDYALRLRHLSGPLETPTHNAETTVNRQRKHSGNSSVHSDDSLGGHDPTASASISKPSALMSRASALPVVARDVRRLLRDAHARDAHGHGLRKFYARVQHLAFTDRSELFIKSKNLLLSPAAPPPSSSSFRRFDDRHNGATSGNDRGSPPVLCHNMEGVLQHLTSLCPRFGIACGGVPDVVLNDGIFGDSEEGVELEQKWRRIDYEVTSSFERLFDNQTAKTVFAILGSQQDDNAQPAEEVKDEPPVVVSSSTRSNSKTHRSRTRTRTRTKSGSTLNDNTHTTNPSIAKVASVQTFASVLEEEKSLAPCAFVKEYDVSLESDLSGPVPDIPAWQLRQTAFLASISGVAEPLPRSGGESGSVFPAQNHNLVKTKGRPKLWRKLRAVDGVLLGEWQALEETDVGVALDRIKETAHQHVGRLAALAPRTDDLPELRPSVGGLEMDAGTDVVNGEVLHHPRSGGSSAAVKAGDHMLRAARSKARASTLPTNIEEGDGVDVLHRTAAGDDLDSRPQVPAYLLRPKHALQYLSSRDAKLRLLSLLNYMRCVSRRLALDEALDDAVQSEDFLEASSVMRFEADGIMDAAASAEGDPSVDTFTSARRPPPAGVTGAFPLNILNLIFCPGMSLLTVYFVLKCPY
jgi:hypothetical protein